MNVNAHGNHRVRQRRPGPRRAAAGVLAALLAGIALLAAACGGGSAGSAGSSLYAKALAYTQCMRSNGEPDFPDPTSQGEYIMKPNDGVDWNSQQFARTAKACAKLSPPAVPLTGSQIQKFLSQDLKWDACMRSHGITNLPDPSTADGGVGQLIPKAVGTLPQFPAAEQACRSLAPRAPSGGGS
jgi:hypothetical protein